MGIGIIVDLIILAIIGISTFLAYKKGLIKLAIGLCAFIISMVVTFVLYQPISNLIINTTNIDETIENVIYEKANDMMQEEDSRGEFTNQVMETTKNQMLPATTRNLAINIVTGGVVIVLFLAVKILLRFVSVLTDAISKLPIIDQINQIGGLVYGILRGILIIYVVLMLLHIPQQINPDNQVSEGINHSFLGKTMYENNILNVFFVKD